VKSLQKLWKLVGLYPELFVQSSSILLMLAGFTGVLLKAFTPLPAFILVLGMGIWGFQEEISERLRNAEGQMLKEMSSMMQEIEEVEK